MVSTMLSATVNAWGLDDYLSASTAAHDQSAPGGPSARVAHCSTIGDCTPDSFLRDVARVRADYGKAGLELVTYHQILSHSHEELDPANEYHGWLAHQFAREQAARAWPGRQIKITTQADNGRWEQDAETGEKVWVRGKWHSHCQIANVAEDDVLLEWTGGKGERKQASYPAGRAVSSDMKNIYRVRSVTDQVVMEMFQFDNEAYMQACRGLSSSGIGAGSSGVGAGDRKALARAASGNTNFRDELAMRLRIARAQAISWDDYEARLAADSVHVLRRGGNGDGVSYKWVADDGTVSRPVRAGGRSGIGDEYMYRAVVDRCAANAAATERGDALEVPPRVLVVPTNSTAADRPRPVYQTVDGRPPWESDQAQAEYAERVRQAGGTYEGRAAMAVATGREVEGVELARDADGQVAGARVDAGAGPLVMEAEAVVMADAQAEAGRVRRAAEKDADATKVDAAAQAGRIVADAREQRVQTLADAQRQAEQDAADRRRALDEQLEREKAVKQGKIDSELDGYRAVAKLDIDEALAAYKRSQIAEFDEAAERDEAPAYVVRAMYNDKTTFSAEGRTAWDHYAAEGQKLHSREKGMGRAKPLTQTHGEYVGGKKRVMDKARDQVTEANQTTAQHDDTYGQD